MSMKISVITVCYNSAVTIASTLESIALQSYHDVEHIIIDGGSTDGTLDVVRSWSKHVVILISEPDTGIYDAMNKGVGLATGDVIAFLNADDFYKNASVLANVAQAMQGEKLDAIYGDVEYFRPDQPGIIVRRYNSGRFSPDKLAWGWMPAHPALFVRKALFSRYGAFRTDYRIAGDFEFIARVFKHPDLRHRHLCESLVLMQLGGISTSGWRATLMLNREMMRACRVNSIPTNWVKILMRYPLKALEFLHTSAPN